MFLVTGEIGGTGHAAAAREFAEIGRAEKAPDGPGKAGETKMLSRALNSRENP